MHVFKKIVVTTAFLAAASAAPVVPQVGNGVVSIAVFEGANGQHIYEQIPDAQYAKMGEKEGVAYNPASTTAKWLYTYQQPYGDQPGLKALSATSTKPVKDVPPIFADKDIEWVSLIHTLTPNEAHAAIALDTSTDGGRANPGTSLTFAHTNTGTNLILWVEVYTSTATDLISVKYNTVAMTRIAKQDIGNGETAHLYYLIAPATGAHNVVVDSTGTSRTIAAESASYTGAKQSGVPDASAQGSGTSNAWTGTVTVVAANSWLIMGGESERQVSAGSATTFRQGNTLSNGGIFDSNAAKAAGSQSLNGAIAAGSFKFGYVIASFAPAATANNNVQVILFE